MQKIHIHIAVDNLDKSTHFYSAMFGQNPLVKKHDYVKWSLTEPMLNFAISRRGQKAGINHLGIEVDSDAELAKIANRLKQAEIASSKQEGNACCYARSDKYWVLDPEGVAWESFHSLEDIPLYDGDGQTVEVDKGTKCCVPNAVV